MKIKIITTGGTIDKLYFDDLSEFKVGESQIGELLKEANVTFDYDVESLFQVDSLDLTDEDRSAIRGAIESDDDRHFLVTHGTDTIIETAKALQGIGGKVIVLTGAMKPARFHVSDAVFNIGFAAAAVQILPEGVHICISGRIFEPDNVRKNRKLNRFESA